MGVEFKKPTLLLPLLLAALGVAGFSLMDAMMKQASLIIGALSAIFLRNVLGSAMAAPLWLWSNSRWPGAAALRLHLLRSVVVAAMTFLFFWALTRMEMAEAIAISFVSPVIALFLAHFLLHERIQRAAIWASLFGTAGVALIMAGRMRGAYDAETLWPIAAVLLSAALFAYNLILSRQQALIAEPLEIGFFQCLCVSLCFLPFAGLFTYPGDGELWLILFGAALLALIGIALLAWAYARAEAQQLIPVEYTAFVWAILFGWLFFDEQPGWPVVTGAALIVSGSLIAARTRPESAATETSRL